VIDPLLQLILALSLSLLFASAGQHKLANARRFAAQLDAYDLLPTLLTAAVARALPLIEFATAVALLIPPTRHVAGVTAALLLAVYALAVLINLMRGHRNIDCGCGGSPMPLSPWLVVRNSALVGAAVLLTLPATARTLHIADAVAMLLMTLLLALCYLAVGQLLENQAALQGWSPDDN